MAQTRKKQGNDLIYALDIGTRSIIGVVGRVEDQRFRVLAIEKAEHSRRAMLDGQIEDIGQVAQTVRLVTRRLEEALRCRLERVCIAAAGRALRTERGRFALSLPRARRVDDELIGQLEAGAVSEAERALPGPDQEAGQFYLVGYTVCQYLLDRYPLSTLLGHNGQDLEAEVVATFLPSEVVDSLYEAMHLAGLEVMSLTLEPIAAINAAIPADLRLLNLVLVDIGAGTSDIAACRDGSVFGYTMATVAGDEITEAVMRAFLVDFPTAERLKTAAGGQEPIPVQDILGAARTVEPQALREAILPNAEALAEELAGRIRELNGGPPSALFLAGGGSKLDGLADLLAGALDMDPGRAALAGNHFRLSALCADRDLNDPELATPLGIAVSNALGLISDSYRVLLNGQPAKLFRNGTLRALDVLLMNGFGYPDLIGHTGRNLSFTLNGERVICRGEPASPSLLKVNGVESPPSTVIHAGDRLDFTPAVSGRPAQRVLSQVVQPWPAGEVLVNGQAAPPHRPLSPGDEIVTSAPAPAEAPPPTPAPSAAPGQADGEAHSGFVLNGERLELPRKAAGEVYYLMDLLDHSGIDFQHLDRPVTLKVNGREAPFTQVLMDGDAVTICCEEGDHV